MKQTYTREKRTLCGEGYMEVDLYPITPEEHAAKRRKKTRPSSERQKKRNAQHSHRWRVQKATANFTVLGFYLPLPYIDTFLPESMEQAQRDLRNYVRRVKAAIAKLYGPGAELRVMGLTGCGRKSGRYHHHLLIECKGLTMRQNADFRQLLEDKWAVRWPDGSVESLGTANADRLAQLEEMEGRLTRQITKIMMVIPQMIDPSVPIGPDDSCSVEVQRFGEAKAPDFPIPYHTEIMESFDGIDMDAAGRVAGNGF